MLTININYFNNNSPDSPLSPSPITITNLSGGSFSSNMSGSNYHAVKKTSTENDFRDRGTAFTNSNKSPTTVSNTHSTKRDESTAIASHGASMTTGSAQPNTHSADAPCEAENGAQKARILRLRKTMQFDQINNGKIYIALSARCDRGTFHPTLLICIDKEKIEGKGWDTNNAAGGWGTKLCSLDDVLLRENLVLLYEVGRLNWNDLGTCEDELGRLAADGMNSISSQGNNPSVNGSTSTIPMIAQSGFDRPTDAGIHLDTSGRIRQALLSLQETGLITVHEDLDGIEVGAIRTAMHLERFVVNGGADATVY